MAEAKTDTGSTSIGATSAAAAALAGSLDIVYAIILSLNSGGEPGKMLRLVASGLFPAATSWGVGGAITGLVVHFALMLIMAWVFVAAARRLPLLTDRPMLWGTLYGIATYAVMNLLVLPLRFGAAVPPKPAAILTYLFAHIVLVGIPIALLASNAFNRRSRNGVNPWRQV